MPTWCWSRDSVEPSGRSRSALGEPVFTFPRRQRMVRDKLAMIGKQQCRATGALLRITAVPVACQTERRARSQRLLDSGGIQLSSVPHRRTSVLMPASRMNLRSPSKATRPAALWRPTNLPILHGQQHWRISRWGASPTPQPHSSNLSARTCENGRRSMGAFASREPESQLARTPLRRESA